MTYEIDLHTPFINSKVIEKQRLLINLKLRWYFFLINSK